MTIRTEIRNRAVRRLPKELRFAVERFYDYHLTGDYVRNEVRLLRRLCNPGRVSLDVGANRGQLTLFLMHYSARVHCFEPLPTLNSYLKARFRECNVVIEDCALGDVNGVLPINVPILEGQPVDTRSSFVKTFHDETIRGQAVSEVRQLLVSIKRLDDLGMSGIGLIKIDVEGFEPQVLEGGHRTIAVNQPNMLIELEQRHHPNIDIRDLINQVLALGYFGYFVHGRRIRTVAEFDARTMQDPANEGSGCYVNNFAFSRQPL